MTEQISEHPILIIHDDPEPKKQWTMLKDSVVVGRDEDCDITLSNRQISRQHIRIYKENEAYYVQDLESRNGTWVNGEQLKGTRRLFDGDEIHVALVAKIEFIGSNATAPLPFAVPQMIGKLRLDRDARRVFVGERELDPPLSVPQYRLLELLYNNAGRICTRDEVIEAVWPDAVGEGVSEQAIDALVRRLRDRLSEADPGSSYIVTVRGHGFRLDNA